MTKNTSPKLLGGYLQWSVIGLAIALFVAFAASDSRSVVSGELAAEADESEVSGILEASVSPNVLSQKVIPDTVNGSLVWPDPWDRIVTD